MCELLFASTDLPIAQAHGETSFQLPACSLHADSGCACLLQLLAYIKRPAGPCQALLRQQQHAQHPTGPICQLRMQQQWLQIQQQWQQTGCCMQGWCWRACLHCWAASSCSAESTNATSGRACQPALPPLSCQRSPSAPSARCAKQFVDNKWMSWVAEACAVQSCTGICCHTSIAI